MARPLDEDASRRILAAAAELLVQRGYAALTLDDVAARARVGKPAIYRRFAGKRELCIAAIDSLLPPPIPRIEGTHEARLRAIFEGLAAPGFERYVGLVGELLGLEQAEPELVRAWRRSVLGPRRAVGLEILREAKDAGTLRGDVDVEFALDSLTGQLLARAWQGAPLDDAWLARTWEQLWAGLTLR